jgi:hypothetical protein
MKYLTLGHSVCLGLNSYFTLLTLIAIGFLMDMTDQEFDEMLRLAKRLAMRVVRPLALAVVTYFLSASQGYFVYPNIVVALLVFVLAASSYGARLSYFILMYLALLVLCPPNFTSSIVKSLATLASK